MSSLADVLRGLHAAAHLHPGVWQQAELGRGLQLHWRFDTVADELVLSRVDVPPSDQEVATCLTHAPAGLGPMQRFDYPERHAVKLSFRLARCGCGKPLDPNAILFGDGTTCTACRTQQVVPNRKVLCAGGCGLMATAEPYHDPTQVYCNACGIESGRQESRAYRAARPIHPHRKGVTR